MRYFFEQYVFDTDRRELRCGPDIVPTAPQVFDLLEYLIRNKARVVSKDDLINAIWNGRVVSDMALTTRINAARSVIGDTGDAQRLIKTLPRKGFRFIGIVREEGQRSDADTRSGPEAEPQRLKLPDKPSIAVLPFANLSSDPEQGYFADGMVDEIITALSRFNSLFVIARNSSFTYRGRAVDAREVGRELGVRYVLEGSVRRAGNRIRITGQLVEAATERHLWADHFEGAVEDVFGLQDQVTMSVVGLIAPKLEQAEIERSRQKATESLDSYDMYLRGMELATKRRTQRQAREFFKKAIARDPDYAAAYAMAAWTFVVEQVTSGLPLGQELRAEAIQLARSGTSVGDADAFALARCGHVLTYFGYEYDRGLSMVEQAVALNPNLAVGWLSLGWVALMRGEAERAIEGFERMIRLSPLDGLRVSAWLGISWAHFHQERYGEGCVSAAKVLQFGANSLEAFIANAVCAGRLEEARQASVQLLQLQPHYQAAHGRVAIPFRSSELCERIVVALQAAGLPD